MGRVGTAVVKTGSVAGRFEPVGVEVMVGLAWAVGGSGVARARGSSMRRRTAAGGRRAGSLTSRASRTGSSGPARVRRPGGSWRMAPRVATGPPRSNGAEPSTANHSVAPSAHRSAAGPARWPLACSGATYGSDPKAAVMVRSASCPAAATPVRVRWVSSWSEAIPKSASLARPSAVTMTFAGLTSWWTIPARWAASRASTSSSPTRAAAAHPTGPDPSTRSRRVGASTSSMTRNSRSSASTTSWRVTTPGWLSRAAALASRSARSRNATRSAPGGPTGSSTSFTATARPSRTSSARHTVPIPPRPSGPPRT